jgi:hypothetical protein
MATHGCEVCGKVCDDLEPSFRRPDAVFAVPEEERAVRVLGGGDLVSIDGRAFFIRCLVPIPVHGREHAYHWGFWVKVRREHFEEHDRTFRAGPPVDHPGFQGTLANQTSLLPPTLGMPVHVHLGRNRHRPQLMLLGVGHPLTMQQERGITLEEMHAWAARAAARAVPERLEPGAGPVTPTLDRQGWHIVAPQERGQRVLSLEAPPRAGDYVKTPIEFRAADEHGAVAERLELMWVELDEVRADGWWTGTLNSHPFVPGPLDCGTRVWLRAEQVIGFERARRRPRTGRPPATPGTR